MPIMQLKRLKCLHVYKLEPIQQLIDLLADSVVPLEELEFTCCYFDIKKIVPKLLKLKQLKRVKITIERIIPDDEFVQTTIFGSYFILN